ncbi:S-layer homology domain-containing protein [Lysinibacillus sp. NPDC056232]|uniref:S-layer homology domain-containing protein n=1 Tax=Lysinibacillus sp. NPDC056232 TaxID=3345756 RepID=UPI0035DA48E4
MDVYKKWLNIAIVFILSFSLLSPAALADTQQIETSELESSSPIKSNGEEASVFPEITSNTDEEVVIDKSSLQTAIEKAEQNKAPVKVSDDGKDIDPADYWVTQTEQDVYTNVIVSAQQLLADEHAIQEDIDAKVFTIENGSNKAIITSESIQKYLEKNIKNFVIQSEKNFKIEVPTSIFSGIKLTEKEQLKASVTKDAKNKQFTVTFEIENADGKSKSISIDKEYLKVTLPANELKSNTVVLQLVGGEYKPVPHKIVNGEIVLFTKTSGTFVLKESTVTYKDTEHYLAYKEEIEFLASRHVIQGTTSETFEANISITRAQFAELVSRALGLQATGENPFDDTKGKWYATEIQALYEAGITKGSTASTFNPEVPITRQQAAALMARTLEYLNADVKAGGEINFKDANNISSEYLPYIKLLNSLDIMSGMQDGSFDPTSSITRGQTAKILKRTLNIAGIM